MKPLVLSGRAAHTSPGLEQLGRRLIRVREFSYDGLGELSPFDAPLVAQQDQIDWGSNFGSDLIVLRAAVDQTEEIRKPFVRLNRDFDYLANGDLISVDGRTGRLRTIYRRASRYNFFLITERCNHLCLMCSQPPKDVNDDWILEEVCEALPLIDPSTPTLGFTGGEPLTNRDRFIEMLRIAKDALPSTGLHVLTNGRAFADPQVAKAWADVAHPNLTAGIPVYSAVDYLHDHVVQSKGAFDETLLGILRLKNLGQRIEIRVVLHALTAPRLVETCEWIARNLPFVDHVALMGLENTGYAIANDSQLWIDPMDYQASLTAGVLALRAARVRTSIYNLPLCLIDESVRSHAVQSISDWKNAYVEECGSCDERPRCAGFFSSGRPKFSRGIRPIVGEPQIAV